MNNIQLGSCGENIAKKYLLNKKYIILGSNVKLGFYEIDIIAKDLAGILIFIEVKTLRSRSIEKTSLAPEDNLTDKKLKKIRNACQLYAAQNSHLIMDSLGWRIDLITVIIYPKHASVRHYKNL